MKKENGRTILWAAVSVAVSLAVLAGVLVAAGMPSSQGTPYDGRGVFSRRDDLPPSAELLEEKFSVYNVEEGEGSLRLFSPEQWALREQKRKGGERFFLTYWEIFYLVEDTLALYESYDTLLLTEERSLPIHKTDIFDIIADLASFDLFVEPVKRELGVMACGEAQKAFDRKLEDLRAVLLYRLYMQDSGWRFVYYTLDENGNYEDLRVSTAWDRSSPCMLTLSLDEGSAQSVQAYEDALAEDCLRRVRDELPLHPLLQIEMDPVTGGPGLQILLWDTEDLESAELFPGAWLASQRPVLYEGPLKITTREGAVLELWAGQGKTLEEILEKGNWKNGGADCFPAYTITLSGEDGPALPVEYTYHPGCGVIYDEKNRKHLDLGGLDKKAVDRMLEIASGAKALYSGTVSLPCGEGVVILEDSRGRHLTSLLSAGLWEPAGEYGSFRTILIGETELVYAREEGVVIDPARGMQLRLCEREKAFFEGLPFLDPETP